MSLAQLKLLIKSDLDAVELLIKKKLNVQQNKAIRDINNYILSSPGKRIRPALTILAFRSIWGSKKFQIQLIIH